MSEAMRVEPAQWTPEKPTADGVYWYTDGEPGEPTPVRVAGGIVYWFGHDWFDSLAEMDDGWWHGPLLPPEAPGAR